MLGKCIRKEAEITFVQGRSNTPADYICQACDAPYIGCSGGVLSLAKKENRTLSIAYYAYPAEVTDETPDTAELSLDGTAADAAAYCAAGELCSSVRPGDVRRYMELMTEYDERMASICENGINGIKSTLFSGRRLK